MYQCVPPRWARSRERNHVPRILVEADDPALSISDFRRFRDAGFEVAFCSGPGRWPDECPLLRGEACGALEGADVVLEMLDPSLGVAAAIRRRRPDLPIVSVVPRDRRREDEVHDRHTTVLDSTASIDAQIQALRRGVSEH